MALPAIAPVSTRAASRYPTNRKTRLPSTQKDETEGAARYEIAGATLLAMEPAKPALSYERASPEWIDMRVHLENRLRMMTNWRLSWLRHWALLAEYILPRRFHWLITPNTMSRGGAINQHIVDPTGTRAMRVCAAGLKEGLTSSSHPWFKADIDDLDSGDVDDEARIWLDHVAEVLYSVMARGNFYDSLTQVFEDISTFGTGPMVIYEDEKDVIRCWVPCAGEYFLAQSANGKVDTLYTQRTMTCSQIVERFGLENCPNDVRELWRTKGASLDVERIVAQAIEPNFAILDSGGNPFQPLQGKQFAYREVYWVWGSSTERPLSVRGFHDLPFITPRWSVRSNDPYGRSVGMDVLPDIMQLQLETKRKEEAIEKHVRPPLLASHELKNAPSSILPGHVTYVANLGPQTGMRPIYEVQPELNFMTADLKELQERIKEGFFNDLFLLMSQTTKEMTATEVAERKQEKLQALGPVIGLFQTEGAGPAIRRIYAICRRRGLIRTPPASIHGRPLVIRYVSMITMAQRAAATTAMERLAGMAGNMAGVNPEIVDNIDTDVFIREYGDLLGVGHKIFRNMDKVLQMRQQRHEAQQQQQQQQMAMQGGQAAAQSAKVLADTPTGAGDSALNLLLGNHSGM